MEEIPFNYNPNRDDPTWTKCDAVCYISWFTRYIEVHEEISANQLRKPLLLEEYGLTWWWVGWAPVCVCVGGGVRLMRDFVCAGRNAARIGTPATMHGLAGWRLPAAWVAARYARCPFGWVRAWRLGRGGEGT